MQDMQALLNYLNHNTKHWHVGQKRVARHASTAAIPCKPCIKAYRNIYSITVCNSND